MAQISYLFANSDVEQGNDPKRVHDRWKIMVYKSTAGSMASHSCAHHSIALHAVAWHRMTWRSSGPSKIKSGMSLYRGNLLT
eukprot:4829082-Pyramimonas_sp.AAC.1